MFGPYNYQGGVATAQPSTPNTNGQSRIPEFNNGAGTQTIGATQFGSPIGYVNPTAFNYAQPSTVGCTTFVDPTTGAVSTIPTPGFVPTVAGIPNIYNYANPNFVNPNVAIPQYATIPQTPFYGQVPTYGSHLPFVPAVNPMSYGYAAPTYGMPGIPANMINPWNVNPFINNFANPTIGYNPMSAMAYNPINTLGVNPMSTFGVNPINTLGVNPMAAFGVNPINTLGFNPMSAFGFNPMTTIGHPMFNPFTCGLCGSPAAAFPQVQQQPFFRPTTFGTTEGFATPFCGVPTTTPFNTALNTPFVNPTTLGLNTLGLNTTGINTPWVNPTIGLNTPTTIHPVTGLPVVNPLAFNPLAFNQTTINPFVAAASAINPWAAATSAVNPLAINAALTNPWAATALNSCTPSSIWNTLQNIHSPINPINSIYGMNPWAALNTVNPLNTLSPWNTLACTGASCVNPLSHLSHVNSVNPFNTINNPAFRISGGYNSPFVSGVNTTSCWPGVC